jgi:uncharacterized protein YndB with AHSA1/START domain
MRRGFRSLSFILAKYPQDPESNNITRRPIVASVTRQIAATPGEVFEAWTNPNHSASPWSERNGIRMVILDRSIDGLFYINMGPPMPLPTHFGRFLRLDKPNLIEHTWASEGTEGAETRVRISLRASAKGTRFTLRHTGLREAKSARAHEEGWGMIIGWLAEGFATRKRSVRPRRRSGRPHVKAGRRNSRIRSKPGPVIRPSQV